MLRLSSETSLFEFFDFHSVSDNCSFQSANLVNRSKLDFQASRIDHPERYDIRPSLAERCLRKPLRPNSNAQDWFMKSFDSRSRSETNVTEKSASFRHSSHPISPDVRKKSSLSKKHGGKISKSFHSN